MKDKSKIYILLFCLILFFLSGCASLISRRPPEIEVSKKYSLKLLKEDCDFLFQTYEQVHPNLYVYTSENVIDSIIYRFQNELNNPISSFEFWKLLSPIVSKLGDGHTYLSFPYQFRKMYLDDGGKIIPFDVRINGNQLFVKDNYSSDSTFAKNSKIVSINTIPAKEILKDLRKYSPGERLEFKNFYIQMMFKPLIWAHYGFEDHFKVEYISSINDQHYTKIFLGITSQKYDSLFQKNKSFEQKPQYWTFQTLNDEKIAIIDLNSFGTSDDLDRFNKFLKSTFSQVQHEGIKNLIIDVRGNGGGDNTIGEALIDYLATEPWVLFSKADFRLSKQIKTEYIPWFLRWIPIKLVIHMISFLYTSMSIETVEIVSDSSDSQLLTIYSKPKEPVKNPLRFQGNTYVLIDNGSYSMSVMFAAIMKDYNFATLIGEETGQPANPYGFNYFFSLPNTHLRASVSAARSYRPSGRVNGRGVIPDFEVKQNPEDLEKGIDNVMEFTKQLIRENTENAKTAR